MQDIDELEDIYDYDSLLEEYFDEMEITEEEKQERVDFSKKFYKTILLIFSLIAVMYEYNYLKKRYIIERLSEEYANIIRSYMDIDEYMNSHINEFSESMIDTTLSSIDSDFYLSADRAFLISVNEANATMNYKDYRNAILSGKTKKQWITEKDKNVRESHKALDDKTISIQKLFQVGKTYMRFPHDTMYGMDYSELSNCRCSIKYF